MQKITNIKKRKFPLYKPTLYMCIILINMTATAQQNPENLGQDCSNFYTQSKVNNYIPATFQQLNFEPFFPNQLLGNANFFPTYSYSNNLMKNFGKDWNLNDSNSIALQNKEKFKFKSATINCEFVFQNAELLKKQNNELLEQTTKKLKEIYKNYEGASV